jgi:hypothetical protein
VSDTEALTPMADLAGRWGVTANTVSRRLAFLGIKPIRQGNFRFLTTDQLELAEALHQHVLSGKPQESFPRPDHVEGGLVARRAPQAGQVVGQVEQVAALVAAITAAQPTQPPDPLRCARALAEAAELGVPLSSTELAGVVGMSPATVSSWTDGHSPRPGFALQRQKAGAAVWWLVRRTDGHQPVTSPATSRAVGFLSEPTIAAGLQTVTINAVSLPRF